MANRRLLFVETTGDLLDGLPFMDGRRPLSASGRARLVHLDDAAECLHALECSGEPDRLIAHVGFCGSTLLARTLDATSLYQTYKEPQSIIDASAAKSVFHPLARDRDDWGGLMAVLRSQFRKSFSNRTAVLKPSNWPLNVLPDLVNSNTRAVFLTADPYAYLVAILRGGDERVRFMLQFVRNLGVDFPRLRESVHAIERERGITPARLVLKVSLLALDVQEQMFARVKRGMAPDRFLSLTTEELIKQPERSLSAVSATFAARLDGAKQSDAVRAAFAQSAKQPWMGFDAQAEAMANGRVRARFQRDIEHALAWRAANRIDLLAG